MRTKVVISIVILLFVSTWMLFASVPSGIKNAFQSGDLSSLYNYFEDTVELSINGNKSMYSKAQANQVILNFFKADNPSKFTEKHSMSKGSSQVSVFTFLSGGKKYRTTILYKGAGKSIRISHMIIEKDSGF